MIHAVLHLLISGLQMMSDLNKSVSISVIPSSYLLFMFHQAYVSSVYQKLIRHDFKRKVLW